MADFSNVPKAKRRTLPAPPPMEEASPNLEAPEHAPTLSPVVPPNVRIDGRSLRRSHRTIQFATRVSPEFDDRVRAIAQRDGLLLVEVLEKALDAYEKAKK